MSELSIVYIIAHHYREGIFKLIDETWKCNWIFGHPYYDVHQMDTSQLKNVIYGNRKKIFGPFFKLTKAYKFISKSTSKNILLFGEPFNLTIWKILINNKLKRKPKKIFLWSHGWYGKEGWIKNLIKKIFFGLADKTFLYGNYAKRIAIKSGFPENKLAVIHNSLNYNKQIEIRGRLSKTDIYKKHFDNDNPVLIFIGRLTPVKQLDKLIEVISILKKRNKLFNLVIIGEGSKKSFLQEYVKQNNIEDQVWFYGPCFDEEKNANLIFNADLCVSPGNVGLTAMHTMVFGTPVISHNNMTHQMPEAEAIIPGKTGDLYIENDINSLADKIENWFLNEGKDREIIRKNCINEIDLNWNPFFQIEILKKNIF